MNYYYDAENRWIGESVSIPGQAVQATSYAYCGNQIVLQFDGTSSSSPLGVANLSHRYLWGPAVDQILAGEQVTDPTQPGNVLLPLTNNLGTVCELAQYNAETGTTTVVDHRVYGSFGNLVSQTNPAVDFLFGFTGRPEDEATGLQNNLNRWYDAATGRWISQDPIGFDGDDTNVYRYCCNSPTNTKDPSGEFVPIVIAVIIAGYWFWPDTANAPAPGDPTIQSNPYEGIPDVAAAGVAAGVTGKVDWGILNQDEGGGQGSALEGATNGRAARRRSCVSKTKLRRRGQSGRRFMRRRNVCG